MTVMSMVILDSKFAARLINGEYNINHIFTKLQMIMINQIICYIE